MTGLETDKLMFSSTITKQHTIASQGPSRISVLSKEFYIVKIAWVVIGTGIKRKSSSTILAKVHRIRTTNRPYLFLVSPRHIGNSVSSRLYFGFLKIIRIRGKIRIIPTDHKLSTIECQPQALRYVAFHETHTLDTTR